MRRIIRALWRAALVFFLVTAVSFFCLDYYFLHESAVKTRVESAFAARVRMYHIHALTYGQIPQMFYDAMVATEDRRFAWDPGIDPIGILRSVVVDVEKDGYVEGGSTITQQLVDNTILNQQKTLIRKTRQAFYAIGLFDTMSKQEVFQLYTNAIYFGQGAYGLYNASMTYFGRPPDQLNRGELTLLAGLPNSPQTYDPYRHLLLARARQKVVLDNMVDAGFLTQVQAGQIAKEPLRLKPLKSP